jgi:hypothetical protein
MHVQARFSFFGNVHRNLTDYQMIRLKWGASQVPVSARSRHSTYSIWGLRSYLGASCLPRYFIFYPDYDPPGWMPGGGSSSTLAKVVLSALFGLYLLSPPFSSFWVEVENSGKPVALNDLSTPYDRLPRSREMP